MKKWIAPILAVLVYCFASVGVRAQNNYVTSKMQIDGYNITSHIWFNGPYGYSCPGTVPWGAPKAYAVFTDGYCPVTGIDPDTSQSYPGEVVFYNPVMTRDQSGNIAGYDFNSNQYNFQRGDDQSAAINCTMGIAKTLHLVMVNVDENGTPGMVTDMQSPHATGGRCTVEVCTTTDGTTMKPATGAVVTMHSTNTGDTNAANWATHAVARDLAAGSVVVFGNTSGDNSQIGFTQQVDAQFPDGIANEHYIVTCTYAGHTIISAQMVGSDIPNHDLRLVFKSDGTTSTDTYSTGGLPDGTTADSGGNTTGGTTTGGNTSPVDVDGILAKLKQMFLDLFTPQQADIDALHAAAQQILSWGPFSLPGQLKTLWQNAFGAATPGTDADPNYWTLNLNPWSYPVGLGNSMPAGYTGNLTDPTETPEIQSKADGWSNFFPSSINLARFRRELVAGRSLTALACWIIFLLLLYKVVRPRIQF